MMPDAATVTGSGASRGLVQPGDGGRRWAVLLAAGEGSRLMSLTRGADGQPVPKQFCSLTGGQSLLHDALQRAAAIAPVARTVAVVAADQERHWRRQLDSLPTQNIFVQPKNRGTAVGILLATLRILARDPFARILFLPSDHFVADESALAAGIAGAMSDLDVAPGALTFLGITPEEADPELGYITPAEADHAGSHRIASFVEKPDVRIAASLVAGGALWNSFIFAAAGQAVVQLIAERFADAVRDISAALGVTGDRGALARVYDRLAPIDFSKHVVEGAEERLRVRVVRACGWSDLGTPQRLGRCLRRLPQTRRRPGRNGLRQDLVNLAEAYRCFATSAVLGNVA